MVNEQFADSLTASYVGWRSGTLGQITDRLERQLLFALAGPPVGMHVLDVGCGDAALASEFVRRGAVVTGLDVDPAMIAAARRRAKSEAIRLHLVEGQAQRLPFDDEAFDLVVAVTTLCFVRDDKGAVREMSRVLRPGGRLLIGELGRWSFWAALRRIRGWLGHPTWRVAIFRGATELCRLAESAGLDVVELRGAAFYPPFAFAARLLAPIDLWLGRKTTFGAAFVGLLAIKPFRTHETINR